MDFFRKIRKLALLYRFVFFEKKEIFFWMQSGFSSESNHQINQVKDCILGFFRNLNFFAPPPYLNSSACETVPDVSGVARPRHQAGQPPGPPLPVPGWGHPVRQGAPRLPIRSPPAVNSNTAPPFKGSVLGTKKKYLPPPHHPSGGDNNSNQRGK